jgi:hypothetical protein
MCQSNFIEQLYASCSAFSDYKPRMERGWLWNGIQEFLTSVVFHSGSSVLFECENETHGAIVRGYKKSHASYESECDALLLGGNAEDLHFFLFIDTVHSKRVRLVCIISNSGNWIDRTSDITARWVLFPVRFSLNISELSWQGRSNRLLFRISSELQPNDFCLTG